MQLLWLEPITMDHATEFIDRIENEARVNPRLRSAMRGTYAPADADLGERYNVSSREPGDASR